MRFKIKFVLFILFKNFVLSVFATNYYDSNVSLTEVEQQYNLSVKNGYGSGTYSANDTVWISAEDTIVFFTEWTGDIEVINDKDMPRTFLVMPENDIEIFAQYNYSKKDTLIYFIENSEDDAEEYNNDYVSFNNSSLELVTNNLKNLGNSAVGFIFRDITIPQGKSVVKAYIRFCVDDVTGTSNDLLISGIQETDCQSFSEGINDITNRSLTQNNISWSPDSWLTIGKFEYTTNISDLVNELVLQEGWESSNSLGFVFTGKGRQIAKSFDGAENIKERPALVLVLGETEEVKSTGIDTESKNDLFSIYPNPTNRILNVECQSDEIKNLTLYDMSGQVIEYFIGKDFQSTWSMDVGFLKRGGYILKLETHSNEIFYSKFIKQ